MGNAGALRDIVRVYAFGSGRRLQIRLEDSSASGGERKRCTFIAIQSIRTRNWTRLMRRKRPQPNGPRRARERSCWSLLQNWPARPIPRKAVWSSWERARNLKSTLRSRINKAARRNQRRARRKKKGISLFRIGRSRLGRTFTRNLIRGVDHLLIVERFSGLPSQEGGDGEK